MYTESKDGLQAKFVEKSTDNLIVAFETRFAVSAESSDFASPVILLAVFGYKCLCTLTTTS
jgi:hypothetical protein